MSNMATLTKVELAEVVKCNGVERDMTSSRLGNVTWLGRLRHTIGYVYVDMKKLNSDSNMYEVNTLYD